MSSTSIALSDFKKTFGTYTEVSSVAIGAKIVAVSDEFFADASNLLLVHPAESFPRLFGPKGSVMDGWESRRHCSSNDWVIIKVGALSSIIGFDIDTSHFNGNEGPAASVFGASFVGKEESITHDNSAWSEILSIVPLGPSSRHLFKLDTPSQPVTHLKLNMHPDGGIARFRVYGDVLPLRNLDCTKPIDLASVLNGGTVQKTSDEHFGVGSYLLLPGRGENMEDGWHTRRSRGRKVGEGDWIVVKLGEAGHLEFVNVDTKDFIGNFPQSVELYGINSVENCPSQDESWSLILANHKTTADSHHYYSLLNPKVPCTHVRLNIYPDGGLKRLRVYGRRAANVKVFSSLTRLTYSDVSEL